MLEDQGLSIHPYRSYSQSGTFFGFQIETLPTVANLMRLYYKGVEGCHEVALAERCAAEPHGEQWDEATLHEADRLVGVDLLHLPPTEEAPPTAPGPLQRELRGCCQLQHCPTSRSLQRHSPKLRPTRTMYVLIYRVRLFKPQNTIGCNPLFDFDPRLPLKSNMQNLRMRDMKVTTVSKRHLRKHIYVFLSLFSKAAVPL